LVPASGGDRGADSDLGWTLQNLLSYAPSCCGENLLESRFQLIFSVFRVW
jgi:hypothetical protein